MQYNGSWQRLILYIAAGEIEKAENFKKITADIARIKVTEA
jgi:hypothetical protein